jgi:CheY-like chemotaxis protein
MANEDRTDIPSKILVVDDNDQNRELLEAYVQDLPEVTVLSAVDGTDALEAVAREHPDLILLDIMMPKMSGFEVCRRLKADPGTQDIPVVMVTALNEIADHEKGIECGCDDFLSKPVNRLELIKRIQSLLRIRHLKTELDRTMALIKTAPEQQRPQA